MSFLWKKRWFFASKTEFSHNISEVSQIALENQTALVMLFFSKTKFCIFAVQYWKIRIFLNFFFIKNDLAWITAIFCFKNTIAFFCQILNFDLLMWSVCLTSELSDIGEGIGRYHLKSSQLKWFGHRTSTRFGGSKKPFFLSTGRWWNNHLQISKN